MTTEPLLPDWARDSPALAVLEALAKAGGEGRFVGGCVRDGLLGRAIQDIDIATPLTPDAVMRALRGAGLGAVPTGLAHGTITAIVRHHPVEVTTLRQDLETFGRHAVVAFTEDWTLDAHRRDLTMNALFLDRRGRLYDYVEGLDDLKTGRVRFVGDPWQRIGEDYLRLLRFLRFHAHYAKTPLDADGLAAASELAEGLAQISGERKRQELLRLLAAVNPLPVLAVMVDKGILPWVLREAQDLQTLTRLLAFSPDADPLQRLAALLPADPAVVARSARALALSNRQSERLSRLAAVMESGAGLDAATARRALLYRQDAEGLRDRSRLAAARGLISSATLAEAEREAEDWTPRRLPIGGKDLLGLGVAAGPAMGTFLRGLEEWWIAEAFRPDRDALLTEARHRLEQAS
ncbi:MAG: CCA tRNA nucleotidyltransferase [Rhodospirillales bacterium]